jgi:DNA-binding NarL/FixJ family response regulator
MAVKPRILLVEDEPWQAETFNEQLEQIRGIEYLGCVSDYHKILETVRKEHPQLIFLDLHIDGLADPRHTVIKELIPKLKRIYPLMKIVAITNFPDLIGLAQEAGADDVRRKFDIAQVAAIKRLIHRLLGPIEDQDPDRLTDLEVQTLRLIACGYKNKEIAGLEHITIHGVKARLSSIYSKLHVRNRVEAVQAARKQGYSLSGDC